MIKRVLFSVLIITIAFGLTASGWGLTKRDRIVGQLKADIFELAREARFSTAGYGRAVAYIHLQAQSAGLKAVTEPVEGVSQWERGDSDRCDLLLPDGSTKPLRAVALTTSEGGEVKGEVVLVNYFFDKNQGPPPQRFDEGNKKRIVFFSRPLESDPSVNGYITTVPQRNYGAIWAARYGAAAVIVRSVQTGRGPVHTGAVGYADDKSGIPRIPAMALNVDDADTLMKLLCPGEAGESANSPLCDGRASVHLRVAPRRSDRRQDNVVIRIPGTTRPQEMVLISAHLDSHDITPGAADDAAGVASVLAVMREFAKNPPARTLLLVLFADEEVGGSGSRAFVNRHRKELPQIVAATEVDDGDGAPRALQITSSIPQTKAALMTLHRIADSIGSEAAGLELRAGTRTNGADLELLWREAGIPEVAILQDFTHYFDKHHGMNDTPENVNLEGLEQTTFLLIQLTRVLASSAFTMPGKNR
jgi:carboxypeptidase Q